MNKKLTALGIPMYSSLKHQQGLSLISLVCLLGIMGFCIMLVLKIAPIYIDHSKVTSTLSTLQKTKEIENESEAEIRTRLTKNFNTNYVSDVTHDDITIIQGGSYLKIVIQYNVIKKIIGNLSVLIEFNDQIEIGE